MARSGEIIEGYPDETEIPLSLSFSCSRSNAVLSAIFSLSHFSLLHVRAMDHHHIITLGNIHIYNGRSFAFFLPLPLYLLLSPPFPVVGHVLPLSSSSSSSSYMIPHTHIVRAPPSLRLWSSSSAPCVNHLVQHTEHSFQSSRCYVCVSVPVCCSSTLLYSCIAAMCVCGKFIITWGSAWTPLLWNSSFDSITILPPSLKCNDSADENETHASN